MAILCGAVDGEGPEDFRVFDLDAAGTRALIAIHSTSAGPAAGGCRIATYPSEDAAAREAIKLSRQMSYRNALAALPFGGGQSVIALPQDAIKRGSVDRVAVSQAFARAVASLGGQFILAEDQEAGLIDGGSEGIAPAAWTAEGVFLSLHAVVGWWADKRLDQTTIAVDGATGAAAHLCHRLAEAGATLVIADRNPLQARALAARLHARAVAAEDILRYDADILVPCTPGRNLSRHNSLACAASIVCGLSVDQLADDEAGRLLHERGILYCPDYIVTAGGMIAREASDDVTRQRAVEAIPERLLTVLEAAALAGTRPELVAEGLAKAKLGRKT